MIQDVKPSRLRSELAREVLKLRSPGARLRAADHRTPLAARSWLTTRSPDLRRSPVGLGLRNKLNWVRSCSLSIDRNPSPILCIARSAKPSPTRGEGAATHSREMCPRSTRRADARCSDSHVKQPALSRTVSITYRRDSSALFVVGAGPAPSFLLPQT